MVYHSLIIDNPMKRALVVSVSARNPNVYVDTTVTPHLGRNVTGGYDFYINTPVANVLVHNCSVHGNSRLSPRTTYLYRLSDRTGEYLKTGITSNPGRRYTQSFLADKTMDLLTSGSRSEILNLERFIVERDPGPLNFERWAGASAGG